jgi:hypothetical protein
MAKQTFTYAADIKVKEKAARKAKREGMTLSERINKFLVDYTAPVKKNTDGIDLPADYIDLKKVGILNPDGSVTPINFPMNITPTKD